MRKFFALLLIFLLAFSVISCSSKAASPNKATAEDPDDTAVDSDATAPVSDSPKAVELITGNTSSNISNFGFAVKQGEWIYYTNDQDLNIYKMKEDGSNKQQLSTDICYQLSVVDDWIYYVNFTDNKSIYKMYVDGSQAQKLNSDASRNVNVVNDSIYYINLDDNNIYKTDLDGYNKTKINDVNSKYINFYNGQIYFYDSDSSYLYKMDLDGSNKTIVSEDNMFMFTIDNDLIYFAYQDGIYTIDLDGNNKTKISDEVLSDNSCINISDGWIYYSNYNDENKLYKMKTDGTNPTKLNDDDSSKINICSNWIYYFNNDDNNALYRIMTDGSKRMMVNDAEVNILEVTGDWAYYVNKNDNYSLWRTKLDGSEKMKVSDEIRYNMTLVDDWIYYNNGLDDRKLYRVKTDGTNRMRVSDVVKNPPFVVSGDWVYFINEDDGHKIYKVKTDGSESTPITRYGCGTFIVEDDWIYYTNIFDNEKLYKIDVAGDGDMKLSEEESRYLKFIDGWVFHLSKYGKLNLSNPDGSKSFEAKFYVSMRDFILDDEWIYCTDQGFYGDLVKINIQENEKTLLLDGDFYLRELIDDWIYYYDSDAGTINRIQTDGSKNMIVSEDTYTFCFILNSKENKVEENEVVDVLSKDTIVVGVNTPYPPYEFITEDNELAGFDIEIAKEIASRLGKNIEFKDIVFDELDDELQKGNIDLIISGLSKTDEKEKYMDFTDSYYNESYCLLIQTEYYDDVESFDDMYRWTVGIKNDDVLSSYIDSEVPFGRASIYGNSYDQIFSLRNGNLDAILMERNLAELYTTMYDDIRISKINIETAKDKQTYIAVNNGQTELINELNNIISELKTSGKIKEFVITSTFLLEGEELGEVEREAIETIKNNQ